MALAPHGGAAVVGDSDGHVRVLDLRAPAGGGAGGAAHWLATRGKRVALKVNSVHVCPRDDTLVATAAGDGLVQLWDLRKAAAGKGKAASAPLQEFAHRKSVQSAYFNPGGTRLLSTSYDDTLQVYETRDGAWVKGVTIRHDNQTGRWVVPFRAVWTGDEGVLVGSMRRQLEVYNARTGHVVAQHASEHLTAIPSRNASHPTRDVLAAGTASGRVHVFR